MREKSEKTGVWWGLKNLCFQAFSRFAPLFSALTVLCAMLVFFKTNGLYPYGERTIAWCDMDQQVIPLLLQFKDILSGKEGFFFSFANAGGMNFYGVFFFFLASPFTFLVAFVEKSEIASFCNILVLLKMCAAAASACFYLRYRARKRGVNATLPPFFLSVLYAYSGYTMLYYQNVVWLDIACLFPLLLLGLDELKEGKRAPFIACLTACVIVNYYLGYMLVVFLFLYAFLWLLMKKDKPFAGNFFLSCAVAALLSAVVWLPCLWQYFSSGRQTSILQNLVYSSGFTAYQTVFPTVFSVLFLLPFSLSWKSGGDQEARFWLALFALTLLPLVFEPINKMWQTGSYMSFPSRYGFITVFLCLAIANDKLTQPPQKDKKGGGRYALNALALLLAVWYFVYAVSYAKNNVESMNDYAQTLWGTDESFFSQLKLYGVALVLGIALFAFWRLEWLKPVCLWLAVGITALSELYIAPLVYMQTPAHSTENLKNIVALADRVESEEFFRVKTEKEYVGWDFDANTLGGLGYNALGHYTSLTDADYMQAIKQWGYTSYWMEVGNSSGTLLTDALLSVKYSVVAGKTQNAAYEDGGYSIVEKQAFLPLGLLAAEDIIQSGGEYENRVQWQSTLARQLLGAGEDAVKAYALESGTAHGLSVEKTENGYSLTPTQKNARLTFKVRVEEKQALYFNAFYENTNALSQPINEKFSVSSPIGTTRYPTQKQNGLLYLGEYENGTVEISVRVRESVQVREMGLVGIVEEPLLAAVHGAKTVGFFEKKNGLSGIYENAEGGECVFLSVPFNEGLRLKINGEERALRRVYGGFTAFYLEAGNNEIELTFTPKGFALGCALTGAGGIALAAALLFAIVKGRKFTLGGKAERAVYFAVLVGSGLAAFAVYGLPMILCAL